MTDDPVNKLVQTLAADVRPVTPLKPPARRALTTLGLLVLAGLASILLFADRAAFFSHHRGDEAQLGLGMAAMFATGAAAVTAAFFAAVPGRSWLWLTAPLPPLVIWLLLGGAQLRALLAQGDARWDLGKSLHCFLFVLGAGLAAAALFAWRLRRAAPLEGLAVATLAGLGAAAFAAFLLNFFHPFAFTPVDLAVHAAAVLLVIALVASLRRFVFETA